MAEINQIPFECVAFPGLEFTFGGDRDALILNAHSRQLGSTYSLLSLLRSGGLKRTSGIPSTFPGLPGLDEGNRIPLAENEECHPAQRNSESTPLSFNGVEDRENALSLYLCREDHQVVVMAKRRGDRAGRHLVTFLEDGRGIYRHSVNDFNSNTPPDALGRIIDATDNLNDNRADHSWREAKLAHQNLKALFSSVTGDQILFLLAKLVEYLSANTDPATFNELGEPTLLLAKWAQKFLGDGWFEQKQDIRLASASVELSSILREAITTACEHQQRSRRGLHTNQPFIVNVDIGARPLPPLADWSTLDVAQDPIAEEDGGEEDEGEMESEF